MRRARRGMVRHLRRKRATVLQVSGDARRAKGVVADAVTMPVDLVRR